MNQNAESIVPTTFLTGGVAQGWHADDDSWAYTLPFDFTYYGVTYASGQTIKISSNGYICLDNTQGCSSTNDTINNTGNGPFIAPLWRDLYTQNELTGGIVGNDIYLTTDTNYFTFRWQATNCCGTTDPVNFSVTIFKNGQIRFDYGDHLTPYGDTDATVGLGKGDGVNYSASIYNQGTNFDKVASSLWTSPTYYEDFGATWSDNIDGTGVILLASSGTVNVNTPGTYSVTYTYRDTSGNVGSITRTVQVI